MCLYFYFMRFLSSSANVLRGYFTGIRESYYFASARDEENLKHIGTTGQYLTEWQYNSIINAIPWI